METLPSSHVGHNSDTKSNRRFKKRSISEEIFRGFVKKPLVLCQRIDITPYLSNIKPEPPDIVEKITPMTTPNVKEMANILNNCSVTLVREDLQRLKKMFNSRQNISTVEPDLKCKICEKEYYSEKKLHNHMENKHIIIKSPKRVSFSEHIIIHEVEEYHRCRKCTKEFKDYNTLKLHMRQIHKKRKCYICFYCNRDFVDKTFFKVHIKMHCDACGLLLPSKKQYLEHRVNVCKILKKYKCQTCNQFFFSFMDLKDHSYYHLGTFFICDICKDQFQTKCAVSHHIKSLHSEQCSKSLYNKSIGDQVKFTCNFCELESVELDAMEKHVSDLPDLQNIVRTGYKDFFFCNYCYRKFGTETDMLHHKWSHFLKNTDNSQERASTNGDTIPGEEAMRVDKVNYQELLLEKESNNDVLITDEISNNNKIKKTYKVSEKLPEFLQPKLIIKRIEIPRKTTMKPLPSRRRNFIDVTNISIQQLSRPIVDPLSKKTILSKHKCEKCGKYLSSNYCLTRHIREVHGFRKEDKEYTNLQCFRCEETFFWPSLLQNHRCIRGHIPEMPFYDCRPEINIDNFYEISQNGDAEEEDYMNCVDFEIAAPIVQLTEYENLNIVVNHCNGQIDVIENDKTQVNNIGFKVVI